MKSLVSVQHFFNLNKCATLRLKPFREIPWQDLYGSSVALMLKQRNATRGQTDIHLEASITLIVPPQTIRPTQQMILTAALWLSSELCGNFGAILQRSQSENLREQTDGRQFALKAAVQRPTTKIFFKKKKKNKHGAPKGGALNCWAPKSEARRVGPRRVRPGRVRPGRVRPGRVKPGRVKPGRVGDPKFRVFFPSPATIFLSFFPLLGVLSLNFGGVFEGRDPEMCTFGLSGCRVILRRLWGRRGFTRQPENSKRAHFRPRRFKTPPKFHERTPKRGKKERKMVAGEGKKNAKFGVPHPSGPYPSGPTFRGPTVQGPTLRGSVFVLLVFF